MMSPDPKEKILIVDDEVSIGQMVYDVLYPMGYQPTYVSSAKAALACVSKARFDLIITDLAMPEMDGLALLRALSARDDDLPAMVMTGHSGFGETLSFLHVGVQSFIVKPFSVEEMARAVAQVLAQARLSRERARIQHLMPLYEASGPLLSEMLQPLPLERTARIASDETGSDWAALAIQGSEGLEIRAVSSTNAAEARIGIEAAALTLAQATLTAKTPLMRLDPNDTSSSDFGLPPCMASSAFITIPLFYETQCLAVLLLFRFDPDRPYGRGDMETAHILAGQMAVAIRNVDIASEIEAAHDAALKALILAIEAKDGYTRGHGDRIVGHVTALANRMGLSEMERKHLEYGAALHDIGKIGIPKALLNKAGELTTAEYQEVIAHATMGVEIVKNLAFLSPAVPIIFHHQEHYDGSGYPSGLAGEAIPLGARMVAVADTFDTLTSDRPYCEALPHAAALAELRRCAGSQLDPHVVDAFIATCL